MTAPAQPRHVAVVGGGIAGLAAAYLLRDAGPTVTVLEGSPRLGGKLAVVRGGGIEVDAGAEALLARRPEGIGLIAAAGPGRPAAPAGHHLGGDLDPRRVPAAAAAASSWACPPTSTSWRRSGVVSPAGLARARQDTELPADPPDGDVSVTAQVAARFGQEVVDRLVEPLLGGVYAGRCEDLSFEATLPALAAAAAPAPSLTEAAASLLPAQSAGRAPRGSRCSPRWPAGSARCLRRWPGVRRRGRADRGHRPRADPHWNTAGG